jgi:hypothetical protein
MLFDIRGKRKRVVQVAYAGLALIFLVGFVGFSIGTGNAPGGLLDAIGLGSGSSSGSVSGVYDADIATANAKLAKNPNDTKALLKLAENESLKAKTGMTTDPNTGQITSISTDAHTDLGNAADAWAKYLKANKGKPDVTVASEMVTTYVALGDAAGAATAARIFAKAQPSANTWGQVAAFEYAAGNISGGDSARDKALAQTPKSQRKAAETQLASFRKQGLQIKKQEAQAQKQQSGTPTTPGTNPLQSPFGGVGTTP